MDNKKIGESLRAAYVEAAKKRGEKSRAVRLPSDSNIGFRQTGSNIEIHMSAAAVTANMQTNSAGFEGWSLALKLWLGARQVTLYWDRPARVTKGAVNLHYARFLYRVQRFAELFPDWFKIGTPEHFAECAVASALQKNTHLFLNVSGAVSREPAILKGESGIERSLIAKHPELLRTTFGLEVIGRQFPVGLYEDSTLKRPVFTGGTSAIDLVGKDGDRFTIIELKAGNNIMVGALGEMLFYAAVIRDAVGHSAVFHFGGNTGGKSHSDVRSSHVTTSKKVRAILLAEQFHPLLEHPELFPTLNRASAQQSHAVPLSFEAWRLKDFETSPTLVRLDA